MLLSAAAAVLSLIGIANGRVHGSVLEWFAVVGFAAVAIESAVWVWRLRRPDAGDEDPAA
jgi:hypothetical protein